MGHALPFPETERQKEINMHRIAQSTLLQQAEKMLRAVRKYEAELGGVAPFRDALEKAYTQTLFNRQRRLVARAVAKEATRQLHESLNTAYDARAALRHFLQGVLGYRSDKLRLFDIQPRKKLSPSRKKPAPGFERPS
jgi:hypothetical protein